MWMGEECALYFIIFMFSNFTTGGSIEKQISKSEFNSIPYCKLPTQRAHHPLASIHTHWKSVGSTPLFFSSSYAPATCSPAIPCIAAAILLCCYELFVMRFIKLRGGSTEGSPGLLKAPPFLRIQV